MRPASWDTLMVALAAVHGGLLLSAPSAIVLALGIWWNSNTISHNFVHRPFFRSRWANELFALWLTVLLGFPQSLWRERHLAHHAGASPRLRISSGLLLQMVVLFGLWTTLVARAPQFFVWVYAPGWLAGLALCGIHGYYEHARGTTSHYGWLYNTLCFNDGYHVEHHASPGLHWTQLRRTRGAGSASAWPAPLRWLEAATPANMLAVLERLVLRSARLQAFVLRTHADALQKALHGVAPRTAVIVGGGLFPRTALILRVLLPSTQITIVDSNSDHLDIARKVLCDDTVNFVHAPYDGGADRDYDLVIIPLSFRGNREALYEFPPAAWVIVHDWIWRRRGQGYVVSPALLKRINVARQ